MAEKLDKTLIRDESTTSFNAPIPGESLVSSPDTPNKWERPPAYTTEERAMEELYLVLTEKEKLTELIKIIDDGVALDEIAQIVLYKGYTEGQYNPDLMLLMIEPTIYLLIAIADYADIKDYTLYDGEEDDPDTEIPEDNVKPITLDDNDNEVVDRIVEEGAKEDVAPSLLSKIKEDLPSKVEEATEKQENK